MIKLICKIKEYKSIFLIINLLILLPSIRFFVKFSNFYMFIFYVVGINILTFLIFKNIKKFKFLNYPLWFIFWGVLTVLNFYIYPIIDARRNLGKGSTGDDAMILASKSLMSTGKIYDLIIDFKTPISPGSAWVIFNNPFSFFDLYFLFTPFYFIIISVPILIFVLYSHVNHDILLEIINKDFNLHFNKIDLSK